MVKKQLPPSGNVPKGFYINSSRITASMFDPNEENHRDDLLEKKMPFLHDLVLSILTHNQEEQARAASLRKSREQKKKRDLDQTDQVLLRVEDFVDCPVENQQAEESSSDESSKDQHESMKAIASSDSDDDSSSNVHPSALNDPEIGDLGPTTLSEDNEYIHSWNGEVFRKSKDRAKNIKRRSVLVSIKFKPGD